MTNLVLVALGIALLLVVLLVFMLVRGNRLVAQKKREVLANAIPAEATVISLSRGGYSTGEAFRKLELKLTLRVEHPTRGPYEVNTKWLVDELALPRVQPQEVIPVKINREDPERIYPAADWAEFTDWRLHNRTNVA